MRTHAVHIRPLVLGVVAVIFTTAIPARSMAAGPPQANAGQLAQQDEAQPRELEPRYQPAPPPEKTSWYNSSYLFGMTRGVASSTIHPAVKVPLFVLTVPLDIVFLPFAAIGGLFG